MTIRLTCSFASSSLTILVMLRIVSSLTSMSASLLYQSRTGVKFSFLKCSSRCFLSLVCIGNKSKRSLNPDFLRVADKCSTFCLARYALKKLVIKLRATPSFDTCSLVNDPRHFGEDCNSIMNNAVASANFSRSSTDHLPKYPRMLGKKSSSNGF